MKFNLGVLWIALYLVLGTGISCSKDQSLKTKKNDSSGKGLATESDEGSEDGFSLDKTIADTRAFISSYKAEITQGLASFAELLKESSDVQEFFQPLKDRFNKREATLVLGAVVIVSVVLIVVFSLCGASSLAAALIGGAFGAFGGWILGKSYNVDMEWAVFAAILGFIVFPAAYDLTLPLVWGAGAVSSLSVVMPHDDSLYTLIRAFIFVVTSAIASYYHEHFQILSTSVLAALMLVWGFDLLYPLTIRAVLLRSLVEKEYIQLYNLPTASIGISAYLLAVIITAIAASNVYLQYHWKARARSKRFSL
jgi:hypothetical protein